MNITPPWILLDAREESCGKGVTKTRRVGARRIDKRMNYKDLLIFCADDERPLLQTPWSVGEYTYATDGHGAVRVAKMEEASDFTNVPKYVEMAKKTDEYVGKAHLAEVSVDCPAKIVGNCKRCDGTGRINECPECEGTGMAGWVGEYSGFEYEHDCQMCDGSGKLSAKDALDDKLTDVCGSCDGTGKVDTYTVERIELGIGVLNPHVAHKYLQIKGVRVFDSIDDTSPVHVEFPGGSGVIMQCRW